MQLFDFRYIPPPLCNSMVLDGQNPDTNDQVRRRETEKCPPNKKTLNVDGCS